MTQYRIKLVFNSAIIYTVSTTEPSFDSSGKLQWTPSSQLDSDRILKIDWSQVHTITYREEEPKVHSEVDLKKPFKEEEIITASNGKKYVALMRATERVREAARQTKAQDSNSTVGGFEY